MLKRNSRFYPHLLLIGCYTLLTIILTYPVIGRLASDIAGFKGEDNLQWRWFLWWFKHSILTLQTSVTDLSLLYAPTGGEQPLYAVSLFVPAVALPLTLFSGSTVSYNLSFLLSFVLTGYTTYLLTYYLTHHRLAGFIAGLIFAFYPARFGYATGTFLGQLTVYFLPLYVLALLMLTRQPTWPRAIWAAMILAALSLTWPLHVAYGVVIFTLPILLWQVFVWWRQPEQRIVIKYFVLTFSLTFILVIGSYWSLLTTVLAGQASQFGEGGSLNFATDILAFISPSNYHPILEPLDLLPDYATRVLADRDDIQERLAYIGIIPLLLAVLGAIKFRRRTLIWVIIGLSTMILSLGPILKYGGNFFQLNIDGYVGYVILPYAFLRSMPVLDWSQTLGRLNVPSMLCLAIMAAYGTVYLLSRFRRRAQLGFTSIISILILLEYVTIFPFPTEPGAIPDFYDQLRQVGQTSPQKIIDLPLRLDPSHNNYAMHYQTVHHQAIAGGHFIRKPAGAGEMTLFLDQLLSPPPAQTVFDFPERPARLALLNYFGFTKVVARTWLMTDEHSKAHLAYLPTWLGQPQPAGEILFFDVPPSQSPSSQLVGLLDGAGWQMEGDFIQLHAPADLLVYLADNPSQISLQLSLSASTPDRYLAIDLDDQPAARLYLTQETLNYHLPLYLSAGVHRLTFRPADSCVQNCEIVNFNRIALDRPEIEEPPVTFGHQLSLIQYDLSSTVTSPGQPILIYLYWQNQTSLGNDYSAFVHLVSPTGELISQADYLLGGWFYPTSAWATGYITAVPTLFFVPPNAPAGEYQLLTGLYNSRTGIRLLTESDSGQNDATSLSKIIVNR